jgi:molecular chaperone DnaK
VVAFGKGGERHVGQLAKRQAITNPGRTIQSIKRHMGTNHFEEIDADSYSPEQISAFILQKLKAQAEAHLGERVTKAIITVPAYFDDAQRLATRDAGRIAGLEVLRIINEPTACALTYGFNRSTHDSKIIIFDFGGGTFDVTILHLADEVLQVKATSGNNRLGGDDFDQRVIDWLRERFQETHGIDVANDAMAMQRLKEAAELAKIELSGRATSLINLPFLMLVDGQPLHLETELTLSEFNAITADLIEATAVPVETALADAKMNADEIDHVILAGGTTRIPAIQQFIRRYFDKEPVKSVNPDEAIAIGAAIQGGIISGEIQEVLLLDVIPMTLGIELGNGAFDKLFEKNTTVPASRTRTFTTASENQDSVHVHIVQGESQRAAENKSLSRFDLLDIEQAPAGKPRIQVTFDVDVDGIFSCKQKNVLTGATRDIVLKRTNGLTREQLDRLAAEAEVQAERDRIEQERVAAVIMAESCISEAERALAKIADRLPPGDAESVKSVMANLRQAMGGKDTDQMEYLTEKLETTVMNCVRAASTATA